MGAQVNVSNTADAELRQAGGVLPRQIMQRCCYEGNTCKHGMPCARWQILPLNCGLFGCRLTIADHYMGRYTASVQAVLSGASSAVHREGQEEENVEEGGKEVANVLKNAPFARLRCMLRGFCT